MRRPCGGRPGNCLTEASVTPAERRLILWALIVVLLLSALDQTIVSTAMPRIIEPMPVAKETSRLSHWPPDRWTQWRMENLTPWKLKSWKFKNWD